MANNELKFVVWEVTPECNHKCVFCYNYNGEQVPQISCQDEEIQKIVDFIISKNPIRVTLSGGEALIMFERLKPYIEKMLAQGIQIRFFTNGALITEEMACFFKKSNISLMVSFPSCEKDVFDQITGVSGSYENVLQGLERLNKYKVNFQPNIVVTTLNYENLKQTIAFLYKRFKPKKIFVSRATKPANSDDSFDSLLLNNTQLKKMFDICVKCSEKYNIVFKSCGGYALCAFKTNKSYRMFGTVCGAGADNVVITMQGDVRICTRDSKVYGNIFTDDFDGIRENIKSWESYAAPDECNGCNKKDVCKGGCHMSSLDRERNGGSLDCNAEPTNTPVIITINDKLAYLKQLIIKK